MQEPPEWKVRENRRFYLPFFKGRNRVCDIGCGHGIFLDLLREAGIPAEGVEKDERAAAISRAKGHACAQAEASAWLLTRPQTFEGIFLAHVLEHHGPGEAARLVAACACALAPRGILVIAVPNPEDWNVMTRDFWSDPTHVRPYTLDAILDLALQAGLRAISRGEHPRTALHDLPRWKRAGAGVLQCARRLTGTRSSLGDLYAVLEKKK